MLKILIAEDDRELRRLFAHVLLKNGYTVKEVGNQFDKSKIAALVRQASSLTM